MWRKLVWRLDEAMHRVFRWSPAWLCNYNERQITGEWERT